MTKIAKGCEIYVICDWNHKATVSVQRLLVTSFGKVRGTALTTDGLNAKCFFNPMQVGKTIFAVADVADVQTLAMQIATEQKANWIKHYADRSMGYADSNSPGYHEAITKSCLNVMAEQPSVVYR